MEKERRKKCAGTDIRSEISKADNDRHLKGSLIITFCFKSIHISNTMIVTRPITYGYHCAVTRTLFPFDFYPAFLLYWLHSTYG